MSKLDLKNAYITHAAVDKALVEFVDLPDMNTKLNHLVADLVSCRQISGDKITYAELSIFKEAFKIGFASAHIISSRDGKNEKA